MKKVLVAFDGAHIPASALAFALDLNSQSPIMLTGVFLPSMDYADFLNYTYYGLTVPAYYTNAFDDDKQLIEKNKESFRNFAAIIISSTKFMMILCWTYSVKSARRHVLLIC